MWIGLKRTLWIQTYKLQKLFCRTRASPAGKLLHLRRDKHRWVQGRQSVLVHHCKLMSKQLAVLLFGKLQEILVFVENLTSNGLFWISQTHDDLGGNRLAAARLANQCHALARTNIKAYMVNNLNVSVRLKADAKIFDAEQWLYIKIWLTPISSGKLNLFECIEPALQRLCLLRICTNWIRCKNVICAPRVRVLCINRGARCCSHSVSKTLRKDIKCQAGHHNSQAWEECLPPTASKNAGASISQDVTPCRSWLCNTCTNEG